MICKPKIPTTINLLSICIFTLLIISQPAIANENKLPSQVEKQGYTVKTFSSNFINDVDINNKTIEKKWFLNKWFGWPATNPATITTNENGIVIDNDDSALTRRGALNYSIASAGPVPKTPSNMQGWKGKAFGGGGYFEAELKFNPETVKRNFNKVNKNNVFGFPAWWMLPLEHMKPPHTQWLNQEKGYAHFIEIDIFEYNQFDKKGDNTYSAALHEWYGVHNKTCPPNFCQVTNYNGTTKYNNHLITLPDDINFNEFQRYGVLWIPATETNQGSLQYFFNGDPVGSPIKWDMFRDEPPLPGKTPWTFGKMDRDHYVLILGTGVNQPLSIRSVNVWQNSDINNINN